MSNSEFDLETALAAIQRGDSSVVPELVERFYPRVRSMVHRRLDADFRKKHRWILSAFSTGDITHEVFLRVLKGLGEVNCRSEAAFVSYLSTQVERRIIDSLRHHRAGQRDARRVSQPRSSADSIEFAAEDPAPIQLATSREHQQIVREVLATFPFKHQKLLRFRLQENRDYADVARQLGYASPGAARKTFCQIHARLLVKLRCAGIS